MDVNWVLQGTVNAASTGALLPSSNWLPTTAYDPVLSSSQNSQWMAADGRIVIAAVGSYKFCLRLDPVELAFVGVVQMQCLPVTAGVAPYVMNTLTNTAANKLPQYMFGRLIGAKVGDVVRIVWIPSSNLQASLPSPTNNTLLSMKIIGTDPEPSPIYLIGSGNSPPIEAPLQPTMHVMQQSVTGTSGQVTFYLTTNGLASGTTWFPLGVFFAFFTARLAAASAATGTPYATENARDAQGNMWVQCNVVIPLPVAGTLLASGSQQTVAPAPAGTSVQLLVIGW
jgi:hypothetical protein